MPRIAEGLHRLGSDLINFYLVEDATGLTVVDAGIPAFYDKLGDCLGEMGRDWGDIRALVLTHAHPDHVGFAERLRSEHGVPVLVHAADEQLALTQRAASATARSCPYLRYPAAWRLMGVLARVGKPSRMRIAEVRTFAGDDASTCPAARACCTRPVTPRGASRCTSRATRRCWSATCCARATR